MLDKRVPNISTGVIVKTILIILGLWLIYVVREVFAVLFVALILSAALDPAVRWMVARKVPRSLAVVAVFLVLFLVAGTLVSLLIPPIVSQFKSFAENLPANFEKLADVFGGVENYFRLHGLQFSSQEFLSGLGSNLTESSGKIFATTASVFRGFISLIAVVSLAFYLSIKEEGTRNFLVSVTPIAYQEYAISLAERIRTTIGKWLRGQFFLMLIIFTLNYLALYLLEVPYALILAICAGLLEIIPYLGPIISTILAVAVGFTVSPLIGFMVLIAYVIIQQIENHLIVPQIMKKAVGLNPVTVILALLVGVKLGGALGAVLAVPLAAVLSLCLKDLIGRKEEAPAQTQKAHADRTLAGDKQTKN